MRTQENVSGEGRPDSVEDIQIIAEPRDFLCARSHVDPLEKLGDEIERFTPKDIQYSVVLWVDPRNLKLSPLNVRQEDPERETQKLAASIFSEGVKEPLLVDERLEIIDGSRRWRIALRYFLRVPVIFKFYGEGLKSDKERVLDSITRNQSEPNTKKEIGSALNTLFERGLNPEDVSAKLGVSPGQITNWANTILGSDMSFIEKLTRLYYRRLKPEEKRQFDVINKSKKVEPYDFISRMYIYKKLPQDFRDEVEREVRDDLNVDMDVRLEMSKIDYLKIKIFGETRIIPKYWYDDIQSIIKDKEMSVRGVFEMLTKKYLAREFHITDEEYEEAGILLYEEIKRIQSK